MSAPAMRVDFVRRCDRWGLARRALLTVGVVALVTVVVEYRQLRAEEAGLRLRAEAFDAIGAHSGTPSTQAAGTIVAARDAVARLAMPWSKLLRELDAAGNDNTRSVALLAIEPDVDHQKVRILAEARDLPAALAYAERLQESSALRFPLLVNHEVQSKDQYQPVRFEVAADWRADP